MQFLSVCNMPYKIWEMDLPDTIRRLAGENTETQKRQTGCYPGFWSMSLNQNASCFGDMAKQTLSLFLTLKFFVSEFKLDIFIPRRVSFGSKEI